ncbi:PAS domain S-box protein [Desulfobacula sp.]|uniref:PAS domain S-box protein n=1 Tax=Desulfobacula sp. TaxID=2593537 RepID=UPI002609EFBC|nr:PAS domain S-box protein [Desulfobacula sp.]
MSKKSTYEELKKRVQGLEQVELEHKRTEEELAQIFSMSLDMICIAEINTATFLRINPAFTDILGYSEEELLEKSFFKFIHPDDIDSTLSVVEKKLQSGAKVINFDNRYRCKDGSYRWLSWVSHPDLKKGVTFAIARDITEWKQKEAALKKNKALLDATGRMARVGGWELDADTMELTWTDETYRIHDVPLDQNPPLQEAISFFHTEDRPQLEQVIKRALDHGESYDMEIRFITAKGKHLWTRSICHPEIVDGKTVRLKGTFQDITKQKIAELALKESEERTRYLSEASMEAIFFTKDGFCIEANKAAAEMFGCKDPSELIGLFGTDIIAPESHEIVKNHMLKNKFDTYDAIGMRKNGQKFPISIRAKTMPYKNKGVVRVTSIIDITDRKKSEKALINSELKWRNVLVNTPQIGITLNPEAKITFVNTHFLKLTGWEEKEVIGQDWFDMFIPEHIREEVRKFFLEVMRQKTTTGFSTYENEILDRHGVHINVSWSNVLTKDINENIVDVTCLGVDLTERRRAETALKESEAYMRSIFRAAPTGIGVIHDRVFRQVNDKFCEMLGFSRDELIGQQSVLIYPSVDEFEKVGREKYEQIKVKGTGTVETVMKRKNGELINVLMSSTPIEINDLSAGVTFTALDITESKQAEKALQESHERFLTVLESIDATIYVADMKTHEILFMNKHMIDSFGLDLTGEICWHAFRGESKPCKHCNNDKLIDENGIPTGVISWQGKNPKTGKWYVNYDRAIEWIDGRLVRIQIATDITDLKKMEEQLRQAQKMESIGRLAGGVAHDFNNMLSIILGNTEMILEDLDKTNPVIKNLHEIYKAAERSTNLTRQLLAFARKQTISPKELDLNEAIERMLKMLRRLIGENINLAWLPKINLWSIKIDPSQIDQILANLCVNAKDAIKDVGKVTIETDNVIFDMDYCLKYNGFVPGDYVMIAFSDNGCGMDKEILGNLFEPFFTTKGIGEGTGLGLATVYGIVKQNNGFINVYSEVDKGTTFRLYFPRHAGKVHLAEKPVSKKTDETGWKTILLVEDEEAILKMATLMLERLGYSVIAASNPMEALKIGKSHAKQIHLLITDVVMPGMNGRELSKEMYKHFPDLKCLFMSGYTANVIAHHGVLDDDMQFIQKPFSRQDLAAKVREVLDEYENP